MFPILMRESGEACNYCAYLPSVPAGVLALAQWSSFRPIKVAPRLRGGSVPWELDAGGIRNGAYRPASSSRAPITSAPARSVAA